ncbi:MAG: cell division protein FtsQ/DivIB [Hasllibacter sp.]
MRALRRPQAPGPRDYAPSRWAYRAQRLWLTPAFRRAATRWLPCAVVLAVAAGTGARNWPAITDWAAQTRHAFETRPEFMVTGLHVTGASAETADAVAAILAPALPASSFHVDLAELRERVLALGAVASADLSVAGGRFEAAIAERVPALIWRLDDRLTLLDPEGRRVGPAEARADHPGLPLVVGRGAGSAAASAMDVVHAAGPLLPELAALVRVGGRRWDAVLSGGQRIMLPSGRAPEAMAAAARLHRERALFERAVTHLDLRDPARPVLRLIPAAAQAVADARALQLASEDRP